MIDSDLTKGRSAFAREQPGWPIGTDLSGLAQAVHDSLHVRPFIPLLVPAILGDFPRSRRKARFRGANGLGGSFALHHHETNILVGFFREGIFSCKNLKGVVRIRACVIVDGVLPQ
jgi:hypothetical protein